MGITKLIILGLLIWLGLRIYKIVKQRQSIRPSTPPKQLSGDLVQCDACGVHLPKEDAFSRNGHFYCSDENSNCKQ